MNKMWGKGIGMNPATKTAARMKLGMKNCDEDFKTPQRRFDINGIGKNLD